MPTAAPYPEITATAEIRKTERAHSSASPRREAAACAGTTERQTASSPATPAGESCPTAILPPTRRSAARNRAGPVGTAGSGAQSGCARNVFQVTARLSGYSVKSLCYAHRRNRSLCARVLLIFERGDIDAEPSHGDIPAYRLRQHPIGPRTR